MYGSVSIPSVRDCAYRHIDLFNYAASLFMELLKQ